MRSTTWLDRPLVLFFDALVKPLVPAKTVAALRGALDGTLRADSVIWRRAMRAGIKHLPESFVRYSPPLFGMAFGAALPPQRQAVLSILRKAFGTRSAIDEARDVAGVFANFASSMTDALLVGTRPGYRATYRARADWHFLTPLAKQRGVIMATAQTAGWDVGGALLTSRKSARVWVVMQRERDDAARKVQDGARQRAGVHVVHVGQHALDALPLMRHLRGGGVLALKFDRTQPGMRTRPVRLFGHPWAIPEGPLSLASLTGAPIVPVFTRRLGFLEYETVNYPPIYVSRRAGDPELQAVAQQLADHLERFVRRYPTQWFHFQTT